jgi:hypothetical protein
LKDVVLPVCGIFDERSAEKEKSFNSSESTFFSVETESILPFLPASSLIEQGENMSMFCTSIDTLLEIVFWM